MAATFTLSHHQMGLSSSNDPKALRRTNCSDCYHSVAPEEEKLIVKHVCYGIVDQIGIGRVIG